MANTVLMMAAGTGGHVIPALSVARELQAQGFKVHWLGTAQGIENQLVADADIPLHQLNITGLRGKGLSGLFSAPWRIARAVMHALQIIKAVQPCAVVGFGGYVTGPGGVAAKLKAVPLLIHEQNAIAGLSNRLLASISTVVMQAFPKSLPKALTVGNPVRAELSALAAPHQRIAPSNDAALKILVVGGSLGAVAINNVVLEALLLLPEEQRPQVRHQVGTNNLAAMQQAYQDAAVQAEVVPFIEDMAAAYQWADWVICRAGALTVSEIAAAGCAAFFVPYPHAVDDHQTANAAYLVEQDAAELCQQTQLTAASLAGKIQYFSAHRQPLLNMAQKARSLANITATDQVVAQIKRVCRG